MLNRLQAAFTLRASLVCPACRGALEWSAERIDCRECRRTYPVTDGIPILVAAPEPDAVDAADWEHKRRQAEYFDAHEDANFEIGRPRGTPRLYSWLMEEKFRRSMKGLAGLGCKTALVVCAGSGMDAEYLAKSGMEVIASDISLGAARRARERARRYDVHMAVVVADVERLPFADASVDLVYVHDGLHHLTNPAAGLTDMIRVAAGAVSVTEPAQAALTSLAVKVGLSIEVEEAGNRVERLRLNGLASTMRRLGLTVVTAERYAMLYRHVPGPAMKLFSLPGLFNLATAGWRLGNSALGRFGNKLTVQARR